MFHFEIATSSKLVLPNSAYVFTILKIQTFLACFSRMPLCLVEPENAYQYDHQQQQYANTNLKTTKEQMLERYKQKHLQRKKYYILLHFKVPIVLSVFSIIV